MQRSPTTDFWKCNVCLILDVVQEGCFHWNFERQEGKQANSKRCLWKWEINSCSFTLTMNFWQNKSRKERTHCLRNIQSLSTSLLLRFMSISILLGSNCQIILKNELLDVYMILHSVRLWSVMSFIGILSLQWVICLAAYHSQFKIMGWLRFGNLPFDIAYRKKFQMQWNWVRNYAFNFCPIQVV